MKELIIKDSNGEPAYPILIGSEAYGWLSGNLNKYSKVVILSDQNIWNNCSPLIADFINDYELITITAGEDQKNLESYNQVLQGLSNLGADRSSVLINFGGGVITDLGGFAAASYMRGIDFINLPSTLLSQVDASVGGKTGINFNGVKNLVGAFVLPEAVLINPEILKTLPREELISGQAENIKHAAIRSEELFSFLENQDIDNLDWEDLISRSVQIKQAVVESDFKETGLRKLLNFGHTAGHAFESLLLTTEDRLTHGEAVALGMLFEAKLAVGKAEFSESDYQRLTDLIIQFKLPTKLPTKLSWENFFAKISQDKKNQGDDIKWTNLKAIGQAEFDLNYPIEDVQDVFEFFCS